MIYLFAFNSDLIWWFPLSPVYVIPILISKKQCYFEYTFSLANFSMPQTLEELKIPNPVWYLKSIYTLTKISQGVNNVIALIKGKTNKFNCNY